MFKRFKDRLNEVSEEVKRDPRFVNGIASVNQLAQQTYSLALNKNDQKSGSRESLASNTSFTPTFSQLQSLDVAAATAEGQHKRSHSSDLQSFFNKGPTLSASASSPSISNMAVAGNSFFSLTEDDDAVLSGHNSPSKTSTPLVNSSPGGGRSRRLSSSSMTSEAANLFPIYESPQQAFSLPVNDLDSTAGSEWDEEGSSHQHLSSISKEQLFQMLQKSRARYHKYKGRYADVVKAYQDLERENGKVKTVMQQTQDKALRRISELREQSLLEQKAKRHLEEELRSELEEKQHVIEALQTKVTLLRSGGKNVIDDNANDEENSTLVDLSDSSEAPDGAVIKRDAEKVAALEEKIKRLEGLLTKCKESIKANKQKTTALTEVKESLAKQVGEREKELDDVRSQLLSTQATLTTAQREIDGYRKREQQEELQIAEIKMMMHQEIITKDEEIGKLRGNLKEATESKEEKEGEITKLKDEVEGLKKQQVNLEKSLESEKASVLQEMSRGKSSALQALQMEMEKRIAEISANHEREKSDLKAVLNGEMASKLQSAEREKQRELTLLNEDLSKKLQEKEEEGRLAVEELELRLASMSAGDGSKSKLLQELEERLKTSALEKQNLLNEQTRLKEELNSVCSQIRSELRNELGILTVKNGEVQMYLDQATRQLEEMRENHENEKKSLGEEIGRLKAIHEGCEAKLNGAQLHENDTAKALQETLERVSAEKELLAKSATAKEKELLEVNSTLKAIEEALEKQTSAFKQLDGDHQSATQIQEKYRVELDENREKIRALEAEISKYEKLQKDLMSASDNAQLTVATLQKEIEFKNQTIGEMQQSHQESLKALQAHMESSCADKSEESDRFQLQLKIMEEEYLHKIKCLEGEREAIEKELSRNMKECTKKDQENVKALEGMKMQVESLSNVIVSKEEEIEQSSRKVDNLRAELVSLEKINEDLTAKIQENEAILSGLQQSFEETRVNNDALVQQLDIAKKQISEEQVKIGQFDTEKKDLENVIAANSEKCAELEKIIQDERDAHEKVLQKLQDLQSQFSSEDENRNEARRRASELEKEILDVKNREASLKGNEQQMISYQKELQERIDSFEKREENLNREIERLQETNADHIKTIEGLEAAKAEEIAKLKADLEIKMRLEREKKNSYKQLQVQSIEYQKKLQEQLTAMEEELEALKNNAKAHENEARMLSTRIEEMTKQLADSQNESQSEIASKTEDIEKLLHQSKNTKLRLEEEIESLKAQNIDLQEKLDDFSKSAISENLLEDLKMKHEQEKESLSAQLDEATIRLDSALEKVAIYERFKTSLEEHKKNVDMEIEDAMVKIQITNNLLSDAQHSNTIKDSEIEDLKLKIVSYEEEMEGLRKDLKSSQGVKAAQMVEFEESLVKLEKEIGSLKSKNEQLQDQITSQNRQIEDSNELSAMQTQQKDAHENAIKALIRKYEQQLVEKEEAFDNEQARIRDEAEEELKKTIHEFNVQIADLRQELFEKSSLYDDVLERHQAELEAKQAELDQEVEACKAMYQAKLAEVHAANEDTHEEQNDFSSWNWERAAVIDEDAVEDLQRTPTREQRELQLRQTAALSPATLTLNVTNNCCNHTHTLEEATEFEYLKNVLYQYMIGKESLTLARVLATVVKFTPDELREVLKHEEKRRSVFASLGLLQH